MSVGNLPQMRVSLAGGRGTPQRPGPSPSRPSLPRPSVHLSPHAPTHPPTQSPLSESTPHSGLSAKKKGVNNETKIFKMKLRPHQTCSCLTWHLAPPSTLFPSGKPRCLLTPTPTRILPFNSFHLPSPLTSWGNLSSPPPNPLGRGCLPALIARQAWAWGGKGELRGRPVSQPASLPPCCMALD